MDNNYIFLPWLQRGLAKQIAETDPLDGQAAQPDAASRPTVRISVKLLADGDEKKAVEQAAELLGPGDFTGIERGAIVKTEPRPGVQNFEPNFFPYIEFYEEDFLWRYTPATANGKRLRPWLALVVMTQDEFERPRIRLSNGNQVIRIRDAAIPNVFPPVEQAWAWAHVQVSTPELAAPDLATENARNQKIATLLRENPNSGSSRLLAPRKLQPNTSWYAFLVPAFERGRIAGLDGEKSRIEAAGRFEASWGGSAPEFMPGHYPVYFEWKFQTGDEDFEALARKILPRDLTGTDIGKLWMDASDINYGEKFDFNGNPEPGNPARKGYLPFEGALRLPGDPMPPLTLRNGDPERDFAKNFAELVNLGIAYRDKTPDELPGWLVSTLGNDEDDPLLVPPVYGRWYARPDGAVQVNPAQSNNWLEQLNLDPAFRVAAGLGAEVVRERQEEFVSRSWQQFSDYRQNLNKQLKYLRFAHEVSKRTWEKHFAPPATDPDGVATNRLLGLSYSFQALVGSDDAGFSVAGKLEAYKADAAFALPVYRRLTRSAGPLMRRAGGNTAGFYNTVIMSGISQFSVVAFILLTDPPFQNFNARKLASIDPAAFVFQPGPWPNSAMPLFSPNWLGAGTTPFLINRALLPDLVKNLLTKLLPIPILVKPNAVDLKTLGQKVQARLFPSTSFNLKYTALLPVAAPPAVAADNDQISPHSFNPFFPDSTADYIGRLHPELFIPNLDKIPPESFVLLQANSAFTEAFMVGMNHEMGAELLWRGFPSDLNATFFRQFWDATDSNVPATTDTSDIQPIRKWAANSALGKNAPAGKFANPLVFVIKAGLLKKYGNLVVYAHKAQFRKDGFRVPDANSPIKTPVFLNMLEPDYLFAGFELLRDEVKGDNDPTKKKPGWYFVLAERPGEMHFGMDQGRAPNKPLNTWSDLAWTDLPANIEMLDLRLDIPAKPGNPGGLVWGLGDTVTAADPASGTGDAAQMAAILQQQPVRVFIHASLLVS